MQALNNRNARRRPCYDFSKSGSAATAFDEYKLIQLVSGAPGRLARAGATGARNRPVTHRGVCGTLDTRAHVTRVVYAERARARALTGSYYRIN